MARIPGLAKLSGEMHRRLKRIITTSLIVVVFAGLGYSFTSLSQAATHVTSSEAEDGLVVGNASIREDQVGSSQSSSVLFGVVSPNPAPPSPNPSPSQPAPGSIVGWSLTASNTGLAPHGLTCSNLPAYTGNLKPAKGARINNVRIEGNLDLSNGDIIVEKTCIRPIMGNNRAVISNDICGANECVVSSTQSVTIRDSEIDASVASVGSIAEACAFRGVGILQRNYMHGMGSGICFFGTGTVHDGLAENNYVTGLRSAGDSHNEAATIRDFRKNAANTRSVTFVNNRLDCRSGNETGGLFIQPTWVDIHNVIVEGNYIEGGGYNLYIENKGGIYTNMHARNNRFRPTGWGPALASSGEGWRTWTDNYRYDSSAPDGKGAAIPKP